MADPVSVAAARDILAPDGVDVLINNAAINPRGTPTSDQVEQAWQTNTLGTWRVTQAFLPPMRARGWGRIVNVSTEVATHGHERPGGGVYRTTKVAMNDMTRALAEDLAGTGDPGQRDQPRVVPVGHGWQRRSSLRGARCGEHRLGRDARRTTVPHGGYFQDGEPLPW